MKKNYLEMDDISLIKEILKERADKLSYENPLAVKINEVIDRLPAFKQNAETLDTITALNKVVNESDFSYCELGSSQWDLVLDAVRNAVDSIKEQL